MLTVDLLPDILTIQEVAEYLKVSRNTIYTWVNTGELPSFKTGNTRRIRKQALLEWIQKKEKLN